MRLILNFKTTFSFIVLTLIMNIASYGQQLLYLDSSQPIGKRVADLLSRMTLEEKIGQLNMPCVYEPQLGKGIENKIEGCKKFVAGTMKQELGLVAV